MLEGNGTARSTSRAVADIEVVSMVRTHKWWTHVVPPPTATHKDTHDAPVLPGISPLTPGTMPRAEDDAETLAHSRDFHDQPGSGRHTADRMKYF
jgi:hypothetical protein